MSFVILIPIYRSSLTPDEEISLDQIFKVYPNQQKILIVPSSLRVPKKLDGITCCKFDRDFFDGTDGYNNLLLCKEFYHSFCQWEYILISEGETYLGFFQEVVFKNSLLV